jgi:hypothetical protein
VAKLHARVDVYVDGELQWENAMLVEDSRRATLKVKKGNVFVAAFTSTTYVGRQGTISTWTGTSGDEVVSVSAAGRVAAGCAKCGRR